MKRLYHQLGQYWFAPLPPERLALLRLAAGGFALWYLLSKFDMLKKVGTTTSHKLFDPVGLVALLPGPLPDAWFMALLIGTIALGFAYLIGWKFRWTGPLFALALLFLLSYRNSWSMIYHSRNALVLQVLIIGMAASARAYSWDAWQQKARGLAAAPKLHWSFGWPIRLLCAATVATYFLAGLAKVFSELGWSWISGEALRSQVAVDAIRKELLGSQGGPLFELLYPYTGFFLLLGIGTMIIELGAPFALLRSRLGKYWAVLTWLMHWGIYFIMGIRFQYQMSGLIFLPFFEIERWPAWVRGKLQQLGWWRTRPSAGENEAPAVVLFDGDCRFCNASVRFIIERDPRRHFRYASLQSAYGQERLQEHGLPCDLSSIILIEASQAHQASTAVLRIARHLQKPWAWAYIFISLPKGFRDKLYRWVADNRYRWFGRERLCMVPPAETRILFLDQSAR